MDIYVGKYKKLQQQKVKLRQGLNLLVGTNGSGKSSFLEYLFKTKIPLEHKICFSSGINESFSSIYSKVVKKNFRELKKRNGFDFDNDALFFDKTWVPWLILLAAYRKKDGFVNKYLSLSNKRIDNFYYKLTLPKSYIDRINNELKAGEANLEENYLINSRIHLFLNELVPKFVDIESVEQKGLRYRGNLIQDTLRERLNEGIKNFYIPSEEIATLNPHILDYLDKRDMFKGDVYSLFSLLSVAMLGPKSSQYIDLLSTELIFKNQEGDSIDLNHLSDGEHQLLSLFSIIDLFDTKNTLFLLDELDSHIHPRNISLIWDSLGKSKNYIITSSHNVISIAKSKLNTIHFLDNGEIVNENKKKSKILETIHGYLRQGVILSISFRLLDIIFSRAPFRLFLESQKDSK